MNNNAYTHLQIRPPRWYLFRQRVRKFFGVVMLRLPLLARLFRGAGRRLAFVGALGKEEQDRRHFLRLLRLDKEGAQNFGSEYGYDDDLHELKVAIEYQQQLKHPDFELQPSESAVLYRGIIEHLGALLRQDRDIRAVVNFGAGYAYVDSELARANPAVTFIGIDRSKFTKLLNDETFSGLKNAEFVAGDIFSLLNSRRFDGGVFFHTRTMLMLPPSFVAALYRAAAAAGFRYIVGFEQFGISRETFQPYQFSDNPQPSVQYRHYMYTHNYPAILRATGFTPTSTELLKTRHPHPDYRVLRFVAKRER